MPFFLIILTGLLLSLPARALVLVSGLDDVLRQAENTGLMKAGLRLFQEDKGYAGMSRLYAILLGRSGKVSFTVLTGMPHLFEERIQTFLKKEEFPPATLRMRSLWKEWDSVSFKAQWLRSSVPHTEELVLVIDNSPASLELAKLLIKERGPAVRIYQRQTTKDPVTEGALSFVTSFDIAVSELFKGNLSRKDVNQILVDLLGESDSERLVPSFSYCPQDYNPCGESVFELCPRFAEKIRTLCKGRKGEV